ncbi:unnamed protein product [Rotaria magnacalcarata]|uniref:Uncharacterized protein n=1 Tax=Rotaria magnacalcarata TaxID=392030 RepID=A0A816WEX9_9BILA|nr:unnamed protein product [Rotaria magnacalcarata]CAF3788584.1 unnamed protein product [Rotaria magnacalcarata]
MDTIRSWFQTKKNVSSTGRYDYIESLIFHQQTNEFISHLLQKKNQELCVDTFFRLLPTIPDEKYMKILFELIYKKARFKSNQLSAIIVTELSRAIRDKNFELCERILSLPLQSLQIPLGAYEITQLMHTCPDRDQLFRCLSILIERNLLYDSEYYSWILIVVFEHYTIGDDLTIEYLLTVRKTANLLFSYYGNNNITPLMLFFHLYSNKKCQEIIDNYLSNIDDQYVLLECDKWNRSYLMHLLCGKCEHGSNASYYLGALPNDISDINRKIFDQCPHASTMLSRVSMLYKLGNRFDAPIKTIMTSQFCLPLRMVLLNFLLENDPLVEIKLDEFFKYFPSESVPLYWNYLKHIVHKQNLNDVLSSVLFNYNIQAKSNEQTVEFLLKQGARITNTDNIKSNIVHLILYSRSTIPFMLLDHGVYVDISYEACSSSRNHRMYFYVCRVIQCGYPSEIRTKFEEFKSSQPEYNIKLISSFIDLKNPTCLSGLCFQKLRNSAKDLSDETIEKFKPYMPSRLVKSVVGYGHEESKEYYKWVLSNV